MKPSILVVDDNPTNLQVLNLQLKRMGVVAHTATDGIEACAAARKNQYDLIFMDCQMPNMDGYAATRQIRQWEKEGVIAYHPTIIAVTANALTGNRAECTASGMDDYLNKPVETQTIGKILPRFGWVPTKLPPIPLEEARLLSVLQDFNGNIDPESLCILNDAMAELNKVLPNLQQHPQLSREAHRLKGMVALFGFTLLYEDFLLLEKSADFWNPDQIAEHIRGRSEEHTSEL